MNKMMITSGVLVVAAIALYISATWGPVPRCKIIDGHEIDDHQCIPYCPPDPRECQ